MKRAIPSLRPFNGWTEGTTTGIALLTGLGIGWYAELAEAARRIAPMDRIFQPGFRKKDFYDRLLELRRRLHEGPREAFVSLEEFRKRGQ